jgi:polysaccharide biosynthesis/export protein
MRKITIFFLAGILLPLCTLLFSSCVNTQKVTYFNNTADSVFPAIDGLEPLIQKGDILSISVSSLSTEVTSIFNAPNTPAGNSNASGGSLSEAVGYLVSQEGYLDFPMLGSIKVAGLTKEALKDTITKKLEDKKLLFDPIVTVRYLNFHVTVLGEVNKPGVITIPNEQVTILEALGMAGDLTIYGKRDNVALLRKEGNQKQVHRLNLNSENILTSPYYYLKSNDVVYVEPNKNKVESASQGRQILPIVLSSLSLLAVIVFQIWNNN